MNVAIFGFYAYGNFGDDLMAMIIGRRVQALGCDVTVYRLCEPYARELGCVVADTVEDLIRDADLLVLGGGAGLTDVGADRAVLGQRAHVTSYRSERQRLLRMATERGVPSVALSIGGGNMIADRPRERFDHTVQDHCRFVTLRDPDELGLLERSGKTGSLYPDIVWQTAATFPRTKPRRERLRVGFDLYWSNLLYQSAIYLPTILGAITLARRDVDFIFIDTTSACRNRFRAVHPFVPRANVSRYQFQHPNADLDFIASLDLVVSSRLHLGLAAMSYGIPFLSVFGEPKTILMMRAAGLGSQLHRHRDVPRLVRTLARSEHIERIIAEFEQHDTGSLIAASAGHLHELERVVEELRGTEDPATER
jgi:polysaccharide pyruvyl transferase WcaK-like protein